MPNNNELPAREETPKQCWWNEPLDTRIPIPPDSWSLDDRFMPTPDPWDFGNDDGFSFDDSTSGDEGEGDSELGDLREPGLREELFGYEPGEFGGGLR